jgi:hypothetical protein
MGEIVHISRIKIVREKGPTRRAMSITVFTVGSKDSTKLSLRKNMRPPLTILWQQRQAE